MKLNAIKKRPIKFNKGRTLFSAADSFRNIPAVIWENIINSLGYGEKGKSPEVVVTMSKDLITFVDNGRGMNLSDLENYFSAHAENKDVKENNYMSIIRGKFGTGSFAAFKIADTLKVTSVKNNKEYCAVLSSSNFGQDIDSEPYWEEHIDGKKTDAENGTKFEITGLKTTISDEVIKRCITHAEKQMISSEFIDKRVYINDTLISYTKPNTDESYTKKINSKETEYYNTLNELGDGAGEIILTMEKTRSPLPSDECGIAVIGDGNLLEMCQSGIKGKEYAEYIIGEANIENLYLNILKDKYKPALIDASRAMELNIEHPFVQKIHAFIGKELEIFRKEIQEKESKKKKTQFDKEMDKELEDISNTLCDAIMDDWDKLNLESSGFNKLSSNQKKINNLGKKIIQEILMPGEEISGKNLLKEKTKDEDLERDKRVNNKIRDIKNNLKKKNKKSNNDKIGGLRIIRSSLGKDALRAEFKKHLGLIIINTDFPTVKKLEAESKSNSPLLKIYLREVALTELAIGVTTILDSNPEYKSDTGLTLIDLRQKINDYSLKFHGE